MLSEDLHQRSDHKAIHSLANRYWAGEATPNGWKWKEAVKDIAESFSVKTHDVLTFAAIAGEAYLMDLRCPTCGDPKVLSSRSASLNRWDTYQGICAKCSSAKVRIEMEQQRVLQEERTARQAEIASRKKEHLRLVSERNQGFNFDEIDYLEAVLLYTVLIASDEAFEGKEFYGNLHLCPSDGLSSKVLAHLFATGITRISPNTNVEVFDFNEDGTYSYYPLRAQWTIARDTKGRSVSKLMEAIGNIIDLGEDDLSYDVAVARLWWTLAYDDANLFLKREVDEYTLPDYKGGPKAEAALLHALKNFSIPQVRREIRNVVKNAAALSTSRDYTKRHALNTIPGTLISYVDRAVSEGWNLSCVLSDWKSEEPILLTVLFNRVLKSGLPGFKITRGAEFEQLLGFS